MLYVWILLYDTVASTIRKKCLKKEKLEKFQKKKKTVALLCKDYMQSNASFQESFQSRL